MLNGEVVLAFIPARGGSKGLPGKNMMKISDKTLIERAIDSTRGFLLGTPIDFVVVSSDDDEILEEARRFNAIDFKRSAFAASDEASAYDALYDYLKAPEVEISMDGADPWIVYLQPTSPGRKGRHVEEAFHLLGPGIDSVVSVVEPEKSPYWALTVGPTGRISPMFPEAYGQNRQALPKAYLPNGAIYIFKMSALLAAKKVPVEGAAAYVMDATSSIDIDTREDYERAKRLIETIEEVTGADEFPIRNDRDRRPDGDDGDDI